MTVRLMRLDEAQQWGGEQLLNSSSAQADVRRILSFVIDKSAAYLMTWPEKQLTEPQQTQYQQLIAARQQGQPVAYLTGVQGFWDIELRVSPETLIPRPETELLVALALEQVGHKADRVLDLGTGTGAIALAIAKHASSSQVTGVDFKSSVVTLAESNRQHNEVENCQFMVSDWYQDLAPTAFDLIVSNPPYVESDSPYLKQGDLRFEPLSALTAGEDGLTDIKHIITNARGYLNANGWLMIEHGWQQKQAIVALFTDAGFASVECLQDYSGLDRVTRGQWLAKD